MGFVPCPLLLRGSMPKSLTPAQIEQYRQEGCVFPIRIMSETEAVALRGRLEEFERRTGEPLKGDLRHKSHLLFTWLAELVRRSSILDAVEDLHGPDLLCWTMPHCQLYICNIRNDWPAPKGGFEDFWDSLPFPCQAVNFSWSRGQVIDVAPFSGME